MKGMRRAPLRVVSLGLEMFADDLERQNVAVTQVNWRPPAGGKPHLIEILEKLEELNGAPQRQARGARGKPECENPGV